MDERSPWLLAEDRVVIAMVRHGQTAWNAERRFLGRTDVPLDEIGLAQVAELGRHKPVDFSRVYASPLARARATAAQLGDPIIVEALAEMSQGHLEGMDRDAVLAAYPGFFERWAADIATTVVPGGESVENTRDRALPAVTQIASAHRPGEIIAIVSHQIVIASVTCTVHGEPLTKWREFGVPNATMTWMAWDGASFELLARGWRAGPP